MSKNFPAGRTGPLRTVDRTDLVESSSLLVALSARSCVNVGLLQLVVNQSEDAPNPESKTMSML